MKWFYSILIVLISGITLYSQNDNRFNPFSLPPALQDDIWSVEFAPSFWTKQANAPTAHKFSFSAGLNYHYELNFSPAKKFAIAIGVGYYYSSLSHLGTFSADSSNTTHWNHTAPTDDLKYSRLNLHRINLPLEFRIKLNSSFKFYFGYQASFVVGAKNRVKLNGEEFAFSKFNNLNRVQHGPRIRVGYRDFFVFSTVYLSNLFSSPSPVQMQTVEIGISIGG